MNNKMIGSVIAGSIIGAVGIYATTTMSPRQRKKMIKRSKKLFINVMDNMDMF